MRVKALALRILNQLRRDRRTLALMLIAPLLVLTLVFLILGGSAEPISIAASSVPESVVQRLEDQNIRVLMGSESAAKSAMQSGEAIASIRFESGRAYVELDGTDQAKAMKVLKAVETAKMKVNGTMRPDLETDVTYLYGSDDLSQFDRFGSALIGIIIFFFVFLVAGISFLQERTTGTLEKLLSTPIRRWEIAAGYMLGFGIFTVLQAVVISCYCIYVLKVMMAGSYFLVLCVAVCTAAAALSLGILLSTAANNEFQMVQFIPIIVIPQIFFSGLFDLSPWLAPLGRVMPLYYAAHGLKEVMLKGRGLETMGIDLATLIGFSAVFIIMTTFVLKRYRRI